MILPPAILDSINDNDDDDDEESEEFETTDQQFFRLWYEQLVHDPWGSIDMLRQLVISVVVDQ